MYNNALDINDPFLLVHIADGDQSAMKVLFDTFYPRLRYLGSDLLKDGEQATDMAQEAFAAFWQQREGFRHSSIREAGSFLFTVVRNKCYDLLKHEKMRTFKHNEMLTGKEHFEHLLEARIIKEDLFHLIYAEIQQLSPSQREVMHLIFVEDLETDEIAQRLGLTPNNIRNLKARSIEKLKSVLLKKGLLPGFFYFFLDSM